MSAKQRRSFLYLQAGATNILAFSCGTAIAWSSPMLPKLNGSKDSGNNPLSRPTTTLEESWIVALLNLGCVFGPFLAGLSADKIGRKKTLLIIAAPLAMSSLLLAYSHSVLLYCSARFLAGLGVGGAFTVLPMYLGEIAEDHNRGTLSCSMALFISFGLLFTYAVGPFLSVQTFCWVCLSPPLTFIAVFGYFNSESPIFLATNNNQAALRASLITLRSKTFVEIEQEMSDISGMVRELSRNPRGFGELFKSKTTSKALVITLGLIILQQFCGITAVLTYMETIFAATNSELSPELSTIIIGIITFCTVFVTSSFVDKWGRKIMLQVSAIGSGVSLISLGTFFYLQKHDYYVGDILWLPVSSLVVYMISFNVGLGPLPLTVMAELFPPDVKSMCSTLTIMAGFLGAFLITLFFPTVALFLGMAQSFWIFAVACLVAEIFICWILPETKGKSLQEIQKLLE